MLVTYCLSQPNALSFFFLPSFLPVLLIGCRQSRTLPPHPLSLNPHHSTLAVACAVARFSSSEVSPLSEGEDVVVPLIANSLEFTLSSPPPLHQFQESPIVVETEHLKLYPGMEAEEVLALQGHEVTDIVGKEAWALNDPEKYEGLLPQNEAWTEFVDEKTGEWVYLDEYGNRVEKPEK